MATKRKFTVTFRSAWQGAGTSFMPASDRTTDYWRRHEIECPFPELHDRIVALAATFDGKPHPAPSHGQGKPVVSWYVELTDGGRAPAGFNRYACDHRGEHVAPWPTPVSA